MTEIDGVSVRPLTVEIESDLALTVFITTEIDERLNEAIDDPSADPYSTTLWPASLAVARELPRIVKPGEYVLDIGAGTGLAALMAAHLGTYVTAYDHDPFALRLIEEAAALQNLTVETIEFDLHSLESLPPADLLIAADLLYDYDLADSVARHLVEHIRYGGRAVVGDPGRIASAVFIDYLREAGIEGDYYPVEVRAPGDESGDKTFVGIHLFGY